MAPLLLVLHSVVVCRRLAADKQRKSVKAGMCSSWGPLATLHQLAGTARGRGRLLQLWPGRVHKSLKSVRQASPKIQDRGLPLKTCTWGVSQNTFGTGAAASEM